MMIDELFKREIASEISRQIRGIVTRKKVDIPKEQFDVANKKYVDASSYKTGQADRLLTTASGTQTIAHGVGRIPQFVEISGFTANGTTVILSEGTYDGTIMYFTSLYGTTPDWGTGHIISFSDGAGNTQKATITVDATNIYLAWVLGGSGPAGSFHFVWKAK
jgi:hypothetical protein